MLDKNRHEIIMKQILGDIFKHSNLQSQLAFKGGTCLYICYELNRFSTDLDFNLISDEFDPDAVSQIIRKYLTIEDYSSKRNTWFWLGSYEKGVQKIKIEISKRNYPDKYININYFGILVPIMDPSYMFAHKLCAITDRKVLQNRDLYDVWFMFNKQITDKKWIPSEEIIKIRTGKSSADYFKDLINFIETKVDRKRILDGLGEVLDERQKNWVKEHLIDDLLFQLKIRTK